MTYRYTRHVCSPGMPVIKDKLSVSGEQLYIEMGQVGPHAFMMLINKWNRLGLIGVPNGGPIYVYVVDEVSPK